MQKRPLWSKVFGWLSAADVAEERAAANAICRAAAISALVYAVFALFYTFFPVTTAVGRILNNPLLFAGLSMIVSSYVRVACIIKRFPANRTNQILRWALVVSVVATAIPNFHSTDIYSYISPGWQQFHYHLNPYITLINETPGYGADPMLTRVWADNPMPYGFTFALYANFVCWLGAGSLAKTYLIFKTFNWITYWLAALLVFIGAKQLKVHNALLSVFLFTFSPLVLLQSLANVHNDLLMATPVLAGLTAAFSPVAVLSIPLIVLGALVKYLWLLAVPFVSLIVIRSRGWQTATVSILCGGLTFFALASKYMYDFQHFRMREFSANLTQNRSSLLATIHDIGNSIDAIAFHHHATWLQQATNYSLTISKYLMIAGLVAYLMLCFVKSVRHKTYLTRTRLVDLCALATAIWISVINAKFYCWYLIMVFPIAVILPEWNRTRQLILILSCTQLLGLTFIGQSHILDWLTQSCIPICFWMRGCLMPKRDDANTDELLACSTTNQP